MSFLKVLCLCFVVFGVELDVLIPGDECLNNDLTIYCTMIENAYDIIYVNTSTGINIKYVDLFPLIIIYSSIFSDFIVIYFPMFFIIGQQRLIISLNSRLITTCIIILEKER